jgi:hypothetical protein
VPNITKTAIAAAIAPHSAGSRAMRFRRNKSHSGMVARWEKTHIRCTAVDRWAAIKRHA